MPSKKEKSPAVTPPQLNGLRERMDALSLQLLRTLSERAAIAIEIGKLKHRDGAEVYQPARERQVIDRMVEENGGPLSDDQIRRIFTEIISACRALEHIPRIAFLGPEHTYSHEAARAHFGSSVELAPQASIAAVFQAVENGRADFGVVPVENSTEGSVTLTLDLLIDTPLSIIGETMLPIRHSLLSKSGDSASIKRIVSHQQSLAQCRGYLATNFPRIETEAVESNAVAAQRAAKEPWVAAIASAAAGEAYGLKTIAANIQDVAANATRFIVMGARPAGRSGADKTTVLFAVADRVGALHEAIGLFARNKINISKIESRPLRSRPWEYLFFADLQGHREDAPLARALSALKRKALFLKVMGSYPEGKPAAA
ncbi:MAG TPA: prephenate dehydratase [Candidatus Binataceae bacterium]|nr:prephenate dehydratase [Candidatus Binataceae bacterium]